MTWRYTALRSNQYLLYSADRKKDCVAKGGGAKAKEKERNPMGLFHGSNSAIFQLQTETLNILTTTAKVIQNPPVLLRWIFF